MSQRAFLIFADRFRWNEFIGAIIKIAPGRLLTIRGANPMTLEDDCTKYAARTLERAKGVNSARSPACGREIRAHVDGPLRSYFSATQQIPLPAELADLIEQLE
jgi:hypothetical protein